MAVTINGTTGIITPDIGVDGTTLTIDSVNDRVGVGTSSPSSKFESAGSITIKNASVGSDQHLTFTETSTGNAYGVRLNHKANTILAFERYDQGWGEMMRIQGDGNIGIGTENPSYPLEVAGTIKGAHFYSDANTTGNTVITHGTDTSQPCISFWGEDQSAYPGQVHLVSRSVNSSTASGDIRFYDYTGSAFELNMVIKKTGNVGINVLDPVTAQLEVVNADYDNKATVRFGGAVQNLGDLYLIRSRDDTNSGLGYTAQAWAVNVENSVNSDNKLVQRGVTGGITTAAAMALSADDPAGVDHGAFTVYTTGGNGAAGAILSPKFRVAYDGAVTIQSETNAEVNGTTRGPTLCLSDTPNDTIFALKDTNRRPMVYLSGDYPEITLCGEVTNNARHGPTIRWTNGNPSTTAAVGNQFVMGTNGTGTQLDIGYATAAAALNIHNGIDNYNGTTLFRVDSANNAVKAAGHVIQVGYSRYDPNSDTYSVITGETKARSAVYTDFTPKYANSTLIIITRMHTRIVNAYGCSYGIDVSGNSGSTWTALDGQVQRNAMDFFYKGDQVNHHYTGFCITQIAATNTNTRRYSPWGQGWGGGAMGTWEISYGHGEHSVTVFEIAGSV